jgi:hypothetical protein
MSDKKYIQIFAYSRDNILTSENRATLKLKRRTNSDCCSKSMFNFDDVLNCIKCDNCTYKIVNNDGVIIKDVEFEKQESLLDEYLIEFFDQVNYDNLLEYLSNEESDFRVTRLKDSVIIRLCSDDMRKQEEVDKIYKKIIASHNTITTFDEDLNNDNTSKPKSKRKSLFRKD